MKKYYKLAGWEPLSPSGFALLLDGAPALTPMGRPFILPSLELAEAIASEWRAQGDVIRKETMKLTQIANVALDLAAKKPSPFGRGLGEGPVALTSSHAPHLNPLPEGEEIPGTGCGLATTLATSRREALISDMISYSETDLICYRAGDISALVKRQSELLDPVTRWAEGRFGIALAITDGLMPVKQPASNKAKLKAALADYDDWRLAALAVAVKSLGSLIIGLALTEGRLGGTEAFHLSQLEERYETEKWGGDEEKDARMRKLEEEIIAAERFLRLL